MQQVPNPAVPKLDFVDYLASITSVSLADLKELLEIREFSAAVSAYCSSSAHLTLGYTGFFCWSAVHNSFKQLSEEQLLDHLRIAAYCSELPTDDKRHIDLDQKSAHERFAVLFHIENIPFVGSERSKYLSSLSTEMGSFSARHEFRAAVFSQVKAHDEDAYISYWMIHSEDQIAKYLENLRFCAGLDAFSQELLSFHGLLQKVFGVDYYHNVLRKNQYALFQDIRSDFTGRVLVKLARQMQSGERRIASDLRNKFPDMYEFYQPELHGARL